MSPGRDENKKYLKPQPSQLIENPKTAKTESNHVFWCFKVLNDNTGKVGDKPYLRIFGENAAVYSNLVMGEHLCRAQMFKNVQTAVPLLGGSRHLVNG